MTDFEKLSDGELQRLLNQFPSDIPARIKAQEEIARRRSDRRVRTWDRTWVKAGVGIAALALLAAALVVPEVRRIIGLDPVIDGKSATPELPSPLKNSLGSPPIRSALNETPEKSSALRGNSSSSERARRQAVLAKLVNEFLLSHDGLTASELAGSQISVREADWINKRLLERGEKWTIAPSAHAGLNIQQSTVGSNSPIVNSPISVNLERQRWQLGPDQKQAIMARLETVPKNRVRIVCDSQDCAWVRQSLREAFVQKGWNVREVQITASSAPPSEGVHCLTPDGEEELGRAIEAVLKAGGLKVECQIGGAPGFTPREAPALHIFLGTTPTER